MERTYYTEYEDPTKTFERGRIKFLQEERMYIQKKTFTKWVNSFLQKVRLEVHDLFTDLADGKLLLKLLEIISGERLGKPNHGKMRVHKVENVNKSLQFLRTKVRLESIGAEDIVDGNPTLILGLIWTIILRFQIQEIVIQVDEDDASSEKKSAKDALLLWCQRKTHGYRGVQIDNFTNSWRNGLGFNALIHSHRPDLINYMMLRPECPIENLNNAFDVAEKELGIARLLDAEDVVDKPEEKSIMTYIASYYHTFAKMKTEITGSRRIAKIVGQLMTIEKSISDYEFLVSNLLEWIRKKMMELDDRNFPNSLEDIQKEMLAFKKYRTVEKPPKYKERGNLEAMLFDIQTKLKAQGQRMYMPPEGKLVHDIERNWEKLEKAEHRREVALREELIRQEKLERLSEKFERKAVLRESWLGEMITVLSDHRFGKTAAQVEAAVKKHEAISADILPRKDRFQHLSQMAKELIQENYHGQDRIRRREQEITKKWQYLLDLLEKRKRILGGFSDLMDMLRDIESIIGEIKEIEGYVHSEDYGKHLHGVDDLLQKHALVESQIVSQGEQVKNLNRRAHQYIRANNEESGLLQKNLEQLNQDYDSLLKVSNARKMKLEESRKFFQFNQDHEEEESWVLEKQRICQSHATGKDLRSVLILQQKHKALEAEMQARWPKTEVVCAVGEGLIKRRHSGSPKIKVRIESIQDKWKRLRELANQRRLQLEDALEAHQYNADTNDAESWMKEKIPLVCSDDYGKDEASAMSLLQRHGRLEEEIKAYDSEIKRLDEQADRMIQSGITSLSFSSPEEIEDGLYDEVVEIPTEVEVEEIREKEVVTEVFEDRLMAQVRALYPYKSPNIAVEKGEVMLLLQKTNADWWNVKKASGQEGFVPANYVKETEPRMTKRKVKKSVKVPETVKVKKIVPKKQIIKRPKSDLPRKSPAKSPPRTPSGDNVPTRQRNINDAYTKLTQLSQKRRSNLESAIRWYIFSRECDDFDYWMKEKEKFLNTDDKDSVDNKRRKFENFNTDMAANSGRVQEINQMAGELVSSGHSHSKAILERQKEINDRWINLNKLKDLKEKSLEGASSMEMFQRSCDEARAWMNDKFQALDEDVVGSDLTALQALQRKHQNLERELAPVQEMLKNVTTFGDAVKASHPSETPNVNAKQRELQKMWNDLKAKAAERRAKLEESQGHQIFNTATQDLQAWIDKAKRELHENEVACGVSAAEDLLKKHHDLADDIRAHDNDFAYVDELGEKLMKKSHSPEIQRKLAHLHREQDCIRDMWEAKRDHLQNVMDLQLFNREADHIDAITKSHETFLEFDDLGNTLEEIEGMIKMHDGFESTLHVQEERLRALHDMASKLIAGKHPDSQYIKDRHDQVLKRRQQVKDKSKIRREMLLDSHAYHEFKRDADEMSTWIREKYKTATEESYRDLNNLERKLQRHAAFEAELKANEDRLHSINQAGNTLISDGHYASPEIKKILDDLKKQWDDLCAHSNDKGMKLHQASQQRLLNRTLEDAEVKLDEMEAALASNDLGSDLSSVKELHKKHQNLEKDMANHDDKIQEFVRQGQELAKAGHFDSDGILGATKKYNDRFRQLKGPAKLRRSDLEESLKLHQFNFDVDSEMQWIKEHLPAASSKDYGKSLIEVQNLFKKHKNLEQEVQGHHPMIDKTLLAGKQLIDGRHFASQDINEKCHELSTSWDQLEQFMKERNHHLKMSLRVQQYFSEANEVESWINEKTSQLSSENYGKDEDAANKLLNKHMALELEIETYNGIVEDLQKQAQYLVESQPNDSKVIANRQQLLQQQIKNLQKLANARRHKLEDSKRLHEYLRESEDLENWITEQMQSALSEEYGQDFEHLLELQNKFQDFKHLVEAGSKRIAQCEDLAKQLIAHNSPFADDIKERLEQLRTLWLTLLQSINARDQKLQAAGEIHRFNRDVADSLTRIQEKYASISDDLGRDMNGVQSLIRKHEAFENELVALEVQLQILVDDSARLQAAYPGGNAEHIEEQQNIVVENWNGLQERAGQRKEELQASYDLHKFLASARDLIIWASALRTSIMTEETVRDVGSAQLLRTEHDQLKAEIDARENSFSTVVQAGQMMTEAEHYASLEIQDKLNLLLDERKKLLISWQQKKLYLDQLLELQVFLRDAKQLDTLSAAQEVYLSGGDFGETVDQVDVFVKKHEAFEKLLASQDEKLHAVQDLGSNLITENHFDAPHINERLAEVTSRRNHIKELSSDRRYKLADTLLYAQFNRDVAEAEDWIEDKRKKLAAVDSFTESTGLNDKMQKLQKHQAFEAELTAHKSSIEQVKQHGKELIDKHHVAAPEIRDRLDNLLKQWKSLLRASQSRSQGLEEAKDLLEFNNQVDKVKAWIRDKEIMVHADDMGRDYEHCLALQKKLDDVDSDMRVDDSRIKTINLLSDKLITSGSLDPKGVQERKAELNSKWKALQGALNAYRQKLAVALEIHAFNRDVNDTNERIHDKILALSVEDCGKDLEAVEALQRKQETAERDLTAIEGKLKEHGTAAAKLVKKYPDMADPITDKLDEVQNSWKKLLDTSSARRRKLDDSYTLQRFLENLKEQETWVNDMINRMASGELAKDSVEAENLLHLHKERKAEIDGREEKFKALKTFGHNLINQGHYASVDIQDNLNHLESLQNLLNETWEERKKLLTQCHDLQVFNELAEQADSWLAGKEAFLNNEDLGESMAAVLTLIKKHENFEKTLEAQEEKIDNLELFASQLISSKHYDSKGIQQRCNAITQRRDKLKQNSQQRLKKLEESEQLQQFLRNIYEVAGWINEKMQVASDESYRDPTNLQGKLQKHQAFEAELMANKGRVDAVIKDGKNLVAANHFASEPIQERLTELGGMWKELLNASSEKKDRLLNAYQALLFFRGLDDLDQWMEDMEIHLQSEDHGKDLTSIKNLLKKHQQLEADVGSHAKKIENIKREATTFAKNYHFMIGEIQEKATNVVNRYNSLKEPIDIRHENLEDALMLYQFYRDVDDELSWIHEKEPIAASTDLGTTLTAVQNLQKKHQALEAEILSHEPMIDSVTTTAHRMTKQNHFATQDILNRLNELQTKLQQLKDTASVRRLRLLDAVESQMFYSEVGEAEAWINEKKPLLGSSDVGKDEDSVQTLMKKLDGLDRDIESYSDNIKKLAKLSSGLIERKHFDDNNIAKKQIAIEDKYHELKSLLAERRSRLIDSKKLFVFLREAGEVAQSIKEKEMIAASEDYGKDLEHVEILQQKFESFHRDLNVTEDRVQAVTQQAKNLCNEGHPDPHRIMGKSSEVNKYWADLKEIALQRNEALSGAKKVHIYDRDADETISWIQEKDAVLSSDDYGHDLESVQALVRRHDGFERDLGAVTEQVEAIRHEGNRLSEMFPDAQVHIQAKLEDTLEAWKQLLEKSAIRKDKLKQAEQLQAYFDDYRELSAWISEMMAKITSHDLARDVPSAEALLSRHKEYKAEIDTQMNAFRRFSSIGQELIDNGHFLSEEIQDKILRLNNLLRLLLDTWDQRQTMYEMSLDTQIFLRDASQLDAWLRSREPILKDGALGDSITSVEELIKKHEDFQKTVEAQEEKFLALKRATLLEEAFRNQKEREENLKKEEVHRREVERVDAMKKKEQKRILDERRREDERRRTQEIKLWKPEDGSPTGKDETLLIKEFPIHIDDSNDKIDPGEEIKSESREKGLTKMGSFDMPEIKPTGIKRALSLRVINRPDSAQKRYDGPENELTSGGVKRVESMRVGVLKKSDSYPDDKDDESKQGDSSKDDKKKTKRTPTFTTRRRTHSFKKSKQIEDLPPVEISGILDRKQEFQSGGKKATIRSWKTHYTVLCGQLMCFFKDKQAFVENNAAASPIILHQAKCTIASDYTKKKNVFRLQLSDNAEFLFMALNELEMNEWVTKLNFHATLPPSLQLMSYDSQIDTNFVDTPLYHNQSDLDEKYSNDVRNNSSPPITYYKKNVHQVLNTTENNATNQHIYRSEGFENKSEHVANITRRPPSAFSNYEFDKTPIWEPQVTRSPYISSATHSPSLTTSARTSVHSRIQMFQSPPAASGESGIHIPYRETRRQESVSSTGSYSGSYENKSRLRHESDGSSSSFQSEEPPPLPSSLPPPPLPVVGSFDKQDQWLEGSDSDVESPGVGGSGNVSGHSSTLPPNLLPPYYSGDKKGFTLPGRPRADSVPSAAESTEEITEKSQKHKRGVFGSLFKKKR